MKEYLTSDVVAALMAHYPEDEFQSTSTELQAGFREVAGDFPDLLGQVSFGKVGSYVSSDAIDAALDSLAVSTLYSRYDKDLAVYALNKPELLNYYRRFLSKRFHDSGVSEERIVAAAGRLRGALDEIKSADRLDAVMVTEV